MHRIHLLVKPIENCVCHLANELDSGNQNIILVGYDRCSINIFTFCLDSINSTVYHVLTFNQNIVGSRNLHIFIFSISLIAIYSIPLKYFISTKFPVCSPDAHPYDPKRSLDWCTRLFSPHGKRPVVQQ